MVGALDDAGQLEMSDSGASIAKSAQLVHCRWRTGMQMAEEGYGV